MRREDFQYAEGDEPLILVRVSKRNPVTGKLEPYPLAGTTAKFTIKASIAIPDDDADNVIYTNGSGITYDEVNSIIQIQTSGGATTTIGRKVQHLKLIEGGHPRTLLYGSWDVEDI